MRSSVPTLALALAATAFGVSIAVAQTAAPAPPPNLTPPFKNLQVLPKDITREQLLTNMKFFAQSLGVRCTFCHVGEEGKPLSTYDFASDVKKEKRTARKMLAMVHRINSQDFGVTDFAQVKVTCFTCHRGSEHPLTAPPPGANFVPAPPGAAPPPPKAPERGASQ